MATITARNVDDGEYAILGEMAQEQGRSISEELRLLIAEHIRRRRGAKRVEELRALREKYRLEMAPGMDSVSLIRAVRDEE